MLILFCPRDLLFEESEMACSVWSGMIFVLVGVCGNYEVVKADSYGLHMWKISTNCKLMDSS